MRPVKSFFSRMSVIDWAFTILMMVGFAALSVLVYAHVRPGAEPAFSALSYSDPARVIDEFDRRPVAEGVEDARVPSFIAREGTIVPLSIERFLACDAFDCPEGSIPISVTVNWIELNEDGETIGRWALVEGLETSFDEGPDYAPGSLSSVVSQIQTIEIVPEVVSHVKNEARRGIEPSLWVIEGVTVPLIDNAAPATWRTEEFYLYPPCAATERQGSCSQPDGSPTSETSGEGDE